MMLTSAGASDSLGTAAAMAPLAARAATAVKMAVLKNILKVLGLSLKKGWLVDSGRVVVEEL